MCIYVCTYVCVLACVQLDVRVSMLVELTGRWGNDRRDYGDDDDDASRAGIDDGCHGDDANKLVRTLSPQCNHTCSYSLLDIPTYLHMSMHTRPHT